MFRLTAKIVDLSKHVLDEVLGEIDWRLTRAGYAWHAAAERLAPVETGDLRRSLFFRVHERTLVVGVAVPYGLFQEYGTSRMSPHPYIRPALNELGRLLGAAIEIEFAVAMPYHAGLASAEHRRGFERRHALSRKHHRGLAAKAKVTHRKIGVGRVARRRHFD